MLAILFWIEVLACKSTGSGSVWYWVLLVLCICCFVSWVSQYFYVCFLTELPVYPRSFQPLCCTRCGKKGKSHLWMTLWNVMSRTLPLKILWEGSKNQNRDIQQMGWFFWKKAQHHISHLLLPCVEWPASSQVRHPYLLSADHCATWKRPQRQQIMGQGLKRQLFRLFISVASALLRGQERPLESSHQELHEAVIGTPPGHLFRKGPSCFVGRGNFFPIQGEYIFISAL